jgi:hypothetical protein
MILTDTLFHDLTRMLVVYTHVIACTIAIGFAFFADYRILKAKGQMRNHDIEIVEQVSRFVAIALGALWVSGIGILLIDFGHLPSFNELMAKPKLAAKVTVVLVLTLNGLLLHNYALPRLHRLNFLVALIGGVSASTWLVAAFLGVGKPLATLLTYNQFMALYVLALMAGMGGASMVFSRQSKSAALLREAQWEAVLR